MINLFKKYFDRKGKRIIPVKYTSGKYLCEYSSGKQEYLESKNILKEKKEKNKKIITPSYEDPKEKHEIKVRYSNEELPKKKIEIKQPRKAEDILGDDFYCDY